MRRGEAMETKSSRQTGQKPGISISESDYAKLMKLADSVAGPHALLADDLFGELERAKIVADDAIAGNVVRMGSLVRFSDERENIRIFTLVFPGEADIADGRLSVLTPVGTALIGLSTGQSISWFGRDGQTHKLTVLAVA
jgi:regulator of nucleoside diphosphate kinase